MRPLSCIFSPNQSYWQQTNTSSVRSWSRNITKKDIHLQTILARTTSLKIRWRQTREQFKPYYHNEKLFQYLLQVLVALGSAGLDHVDKHLSQLCHQTNHNVQAGGIKYWPSSTYHNHNLTLNRMGNMIYFMKPQDKQGNIPQLSKVFAKIHLTKTNQRQYTSKIVALWNYKHKQRIYIRKPSIRETECHESED